MTRSISQEEFLAAAPEVLSSMQHDDFVIRRNGEFVAALVSEEDYEFIRRARAQKALAALKDLQEAVRSSGASHDELLELEKALDRKAS